MWASQPGTSPLCRRPIHDDVDPQDLHGVEGVGQVAHGGQSDEAQGRDAPVGHKQQDRAPLAAACPMQMQLMTALGEAGLDLRAQLKSDKVFDVMKNPLAFLHCVPARDETAFICKEGLVESQLWQLLNEVTVSPRGDTMLVPLLPVSPCWHYRGHTGRE